MSAGGFSSWRARQRCGMMDDVCVAVFIEEDEGACDGYVLDRLDMDWTISLLTLTLTLTLTLSLSLSLSLKTLPNSPVNFLKSLKSPLTVPPSPQSHFKLCLFTLHNLHTFF